MQCSVCYEAYDTVDHRPKIVPCGHTFCLQCLSLFESNECPTCRVEFDGSPNELTDNFLALEEPADMRIVQRTLWCDTCCDAPRVDCVENHDVCSSRSVHTRLQGDLLIALRAEHAVLSRDGEARDRMAQEMGVALDALEEKASRERSAVKEEMRQITRVGVSPFCRGTAGGSNGVKGAQMAIRTAENRTAVVQEALSMLDATEAQLKVKCGTQWRRFSASFAAEGASESQGGNPGNRMLLYMAYALSRRPPPDVRQSATSILTVSVKAPRLLTPLPDVSIEFVDMPTRHTLVNQWGKGWRRYLICKSCLESVHTESFTPQPPDAEDAAIEKGAVCVGRSSGKFYFILCDDMKNKFCLPLGASFRVVGRVVANLASLEKAVKTSVSSADIIEILPKL